MKHMPDFSFVQRLKSFRHAYRGAATLLRTQHNARLHAFATAVVFAAGFLLHVSRTDWMLLIVAIALVWIAEALNTAIEFLADELTLEQRERIKFAKDLSAFAVLVSAIVALAIGAIVFVPHM